MNHIIHRAGDRGVGEYGWLSTRYSFSFADWYDPQRMGFGVLRVLNDDVIAPQSGFDLHAHQNMEIVTIVTRGAVSHSDSMGNSYLVPAGDVQVMSAGSGVTHSEKNASRDTPLELFQIWILPRVLNTLPRYEQRSFGIGHKINTLELLVAPTREEDALRVDQDVFLWFGEYDKGKTISHTLRNSDSGVYLFVISGTIEVEGEILSSRDAIGITQNTVVDIQIRESGKFLLFEVPLVSSS